MKNTHQPTVCIHAGSEKVAEHQSVVTPIYPASSFKYREMGNNVYPRYFNTPNQQVIIEKLCQLEGSEAGILTSSGMAAISTTLFALLNEGDHVIFSKEIYGGTFSLVTNEFQKRGIKYNFVEGHEVADFEELIQDNTKLIYFETPSNPLLTILDTKGIVALAKKHQLLTVVDNTFASPINQNPILQGVDVVIHSGTKYLGGHSDLCFGAILSSEKLMQPILKTAKLYGGSLNAMDCYLIERSLKTLSVRVLQQNANATKIANYLNNSSAIKNVYHPSLAEHPRHAIAAEQMNGFGGMLSFELATDDMRAIGDFLETLKIVQVALSLGGIETLICSPAETSHIAMPPEERQKAGITDGLLRLSVGIEHADDLITDLENALKKVRIGALLA